jgi:hypothetical protein
MGLQEYSQAQGAAGAVEVVRDLSTETNLLKVFRKLATRLVAETKSCYPQPNEIDA